MSLLQLTEYLLWKSIKQKKASSISLKQELLQKKEELFDGDMICRVCTNAADIPVTNRIDNILIMSAIRTVANISINESDYYPKYVCRHCLDELKIAFKFKRKCEASDMMFRRAISTETLIATSAQPMVMHDFELILHEMRQRQTLLSTPMQDNELVEDGFSTREYNEAPSSSEASEEIVTQSKKIPKTRPKKRQASRQNKHVSRQILKLLKTSKVTKKKNSSTEKKNLLKKCPEKKLRDFKCKRCDVKFNNKEEMLEHKKHNGCIYHPCPICGKLVLNLMQHKNIVHLRPNKYTCHQCGKIYYSSGALANHLQVHKETYEYSCDLCPYKGKRKSYLVCHMRVHTGEHRYLCSKCPAKFTNPSNLRKHQLMHVGKKFECNKCKKLFRQKKIMQEHYDSAHLNIRYRCSICGRDLSTRKKLLSHELRVHKREKHKLFQELQKVVISNENE